MYGGAGYFQVVVCWWGKASVVYKRNQSYDLLPTRKVKEKNVVHSIKRRGQKYMAKTQQLTLKAFATSS